MSSHPVGRSAARPAKDRASLCLFTFTDGRRCRTPRTTGHAHFCFYHAHKESQARVAEKLGNDLNFFLSGEYLSANDLAVALGRIIPAVVRGDIKPRTATTVAYLAQTLLQTIQVAQHEYINAFGTPDWREVIHNAVGQNWKYRHPAPPSSPAPAPPPNSSADASSAPATTSNPSVAPSNDCHSEQREESAFSPVLHNEPVPDESLVAGVGAGLQPGPSPVANTNPLSSSWEYPDDSGPSEHDQPDSPPEPDREVTDEEELANGANNRDEVEEEDDDFVDVPTLPAGGDRPSATNADRNQPLPRPQ